MRFVRKFKRFWTVTIIELRIWLAAAVGLVALLVVGVILFSPYFNVREMRIKRQDARLDIEEVQRALTPLFNERLLFVSKAQVRNLLTPILPDLQSVEIGKDYPSTLDVTVTLDGLLAEVTIDTPRSASGSMATGSGSGMHQYITRDGYLVVSPTVVSGGPYQMLKLTDWAIAPSNRTRVFRSEDLRTILLTLDILRRDYGLDTLETLYFMRAREFHIKTDKVELWFDLESPLSAQIQRFRQFLAEATFDDAKEYIDLRIADTIVYK